MPGTAAVTASRTQILVRGTGAVAWRLMPGNERVIRRDMRGAVLADEVMVQLRQGMLPLAPAPVPRSKILG
jgi:hypothetical protein